jgi:glycosyltransferase involved in cell wall biosynthesis
VAAPLRILHCLRAPVGGLFRHVLDLAEAQAALGHAVGILADSRASDALTAGKLETIRPRLALGLHLAPMSRNPGIGDVGAASTVARAARRLDLDVLHGHGAKGGLYARLAAARLRLTGHRLACIYTPHGGVLHFDPGSAKGRVLLGTERALGILTHGIVFESAFSATAYCSKVGAPSCPSRVIPNGLRPAEFAPVEPTADVADFVFVGELRHLKGVDVMLEALAAIARPCPPTACVVGAGPEMEAFKALAARLDLGGRVRFHGALPAREAFGLGRCLVVPSRAESFPYVVLEAAAGGLPMIATRVGGVPEIFEPLADRLVPPGVSASLRHRMELFLNDPEPFRNDATALRAGVRQRFTVQAMTDGVLGLYRLGLATSG